MRPFRRLHVPRFNIQQLLLLTMLVGVILAMVANARRQQPAQSFDAIAFSADGTRIAIVGEQNTQVINLSDKSMLGSIPIGFSGYGGRQVVSFVDDDTIALWCQGNQIPGPVSGVYLYSISDGELRSQKSIGRWGDSMAVCPAGFAVRDSAKSKLTFYPFQPDAVPISTAVRKSDDRIWLSDSGHWVTLFSDFHQSRGPNMPGPTPSTVLLNLNSKKTETFDLALSDAVLSPDGSRLLLSGRDGTKLMDRITQSIIWRNELGKRAEDGRFSQDGSMVGVQGIIESRNSNTSERDQFISVLNANSGQEMLRIDTNDRLPAGFAFSPNGTTIAVAEGTEYFRGVQLWDIPTGKMVGYVGGTGRLQQLLLFPTLLLVWALVWIRTKPSSDQTGEVGAENQVNQLAPTRSRSTLGRALYAGIAVSGLIIIYWFSAVCFFSMADAGQFGQLALWSQSLATAIVSGASLFGVGLIVFGIRRAVR